MTTDEANLKGKIGLAATPPLQGMPCWTQRSLWRPEKYRLPWTYKSMKNHFINEKSMKIARLKNMRKVCIKMKKRYQNLS